MARKHMGPGDAVRAAIVTQSGTMIPIHWGTFELGDDGEREAVDTLRAEVAALAPPCRPRVVVLRNGESVNVPALDSTSRLPSARACGIVQ